MKNFVWIFKHYFKRNVLVPSNLLLIGLPLVFLFAFDLVGQFLSSAAHDTLNFTMLAIPMVLGFLFFGTDITGNWLHSDLKSSVGARLLVTGIDKRTFFFSVTVAGWFYLFAMGMLLVAIVSLLFDGDWGNYVMVMIVIFLLALMVQLIGVLIFYFTKDKKSNARVSYLFGEVFICLSIVPYVFNLGELITSIFNHLPVGIGLQAIQADSITNALPNLGMLLGYILVLVMAVLTVGRRKEQYDDCI